MNVTVFLLVELSTHCAPIGRQSDIPGDNRLPEVSLLMTAGIILLERQTIGRAGLLELQQIRITRICRFTEIWSELQRDIHRVNLQNRFYILRETRLNYGSLCIIYEVLENIFYMRGY